MTAAAAFTARTARKSKNSGLPRKPLINEKRPQAPHAFEEALRAVASSQTHSLETPKINNTLRMLGFKAHWKYMREVLTEEELVDMKIEQSSRQITRSSLLPIHLPHFSYTWKKCYVRVNTRRVHTVK
jgi:hypothetical protein